MRKEGLPYRRPAVYAYTWLDGDHWRRETVPGTGPPASNRMSMSAASGVSSVYGVPVMASGSEE